MLESRRALLFFDEADALFGRRTATKDAHDRYANLETAYLLQRLENHRGPVVLATNLIENIDGAFLRRLQVVAQFPLPGHDERVRMWARMLPRDRDDEIELEMLGRYFALSGAEIRNSIVTATLLAGDASERLGWRHVVTSSVRELRKRGRLIDPKEFGPLAPFVPAVT